MIEESLVSNGLGKDFYDFIDKNINIDPNVLLLKFKNKPSEFPIEKAVIQIECRQKTKKKLSDFIKNKRFLFPDLISAEQATDQEVASYHRDVVGKDKKIIDLTGGLCIDAFTIAGQNDVTSIEINPNKASTAIYNSALLKINSIKIVCDDSIHYLQNHKDFYDLAFIDPSRRDTDNRRTYRLEDCYPDILANITTIKKRCKRVLVKVSPMLDINQLLKDLPGITEFHIVCKEGECKEILINSDLEIKSTTDFIKIYIVSISKNNREILEVTMQELGNSKTFAKIEDVSEGIYIYDPNPALHKLNISQWLCNKYEGLTKLSPNTDLYISHILHTEFPGRVMRINKILNKATLKSLKKLRRDIVSRNYNLSAEQIRHKYDIKAGNNTYYIYAFKCSQDEKPIITDCSRIFLD